MSAEYSLSGDSRAATNLTIDYFVSKISKVIVKLSDTAATVHWLGVELGTHEAAKIAKRSSYSKKLESHKHQREKGAEPLKAN